MHKDDDPPSDAPDAHIAERLRRARELQNLSQEELAKSAGVARNTVVRYEQGNLGRMKALASIARVLQVPMNLLVNLAQEPFDEFLKARWMNVLGETQAQLAGVKTIPEGDIPEGIRKLAPEKIKALVERLKPILEKVDAQLKASEAATPRWKTVVLPHEEDPEIEAVSRMVAQLNNQNITREVLNMLFDGMPPDLRQQLLSQTRGFVRALQAEWDIDTPKG